MRIHWSMASMDDWLNPQLPMELIPVHVQGHVFMSRKSPATSLASAVQENPWAMISDAVHITGGHILVIFIYFLNFYECIVDAADISLFGPAHIDVTRCTGLALHFCPSFILHQPCLWKFRVGSLVLSFTFERDRETNSTCLLQATLATEIFWSRCYKDQSGKSLVALLKGHSPKTKEHLICSESMWTSWMKVELVIFTSTLTFAYLDQGHASDHVAAGQMSAGLVTAGFMTTLQILQLVSARWCAHTHIHAHLKMFKAFGMSVYVRIAGSMEWSTESIQGWHVLWVRPCGGRLHLGRHIIWSQGRWETDSISMLRACLDLQHSIHIKSRKYIAFRCVS